MPDDEPAGPVVPAHAAVNLRRAAMLSGGLAVAALAVTSVVGHPLAGVFFAVGLAGGWVNVHSVQRSVARFADGSLGGKRVFIGAVMARLGIFTLVAIGVAFFVRPDGLGLVAGLAVFQLLMVGTASVPVFKELKKV